ncbi:MAG: hypothetical protein U1F36_12255 [Planctomycetota bacterium]
MNRILIASALAALSLGTTARAQGSGPDSTKEQIQREIDQQQKLMREGKVVRSNVRITLRLKNGSRMKGVVKDGRFVERPQGLEFLPSELTAEDAGVRLWYYDQTNSFIFLPYADIAYHKIGDRLTDEEVKKIAEELDRIALDKARLKDDPSAKSKDEPKKDGAPAKDGPELPTMTDDQKAILAEFPPSEGWSYDRMRELEARKIRIGVYPNEHEQRFLDNFGLWSQASQIAQQIAEIQANQRANGTPAPAGETAGTSTVQKPAEKSGGLPVPGAQPGKTPTTPMKTPMRR